MLGPQRKICCLQRPRGRRVAWLNRKGNVGFLLASVAIGLVVIKAAGRLGAVTSGFQAVYTLCLVLALFYDAHGCSGCSGAGGDLDSRSKTVFEICHSYYEAVRTSIGNSPSKPKMAWVPAPRPGFRSWTVVPREAEPGVTGLGWVGLSWAGLRERNFGLQAPGCLYWARLLVSLGGDQEFLPLCQPGLKCLLLPLLEEPPLSSQGWMLAPPA